MRAALVTSLGEPRDCIEIVNAPVPDPGPGQVLVAVLAGAVNFPDVLMVRGTYQERPPLPFTPGVEVCGRVVAVGEGVAHLLPGMRVLGTTSMPHGGLAEHCLLLASDTHVAPESLDDAAAAAMHIAYQTGWFSLHRRARLQEGETLLVHAAAGGVGTAAVQLGKAAGARVIGVVSSQAKAHTAAEAGADVVVVRGEQDFVEVVKAATGGRGADVVFDPVGGEAYRRSTKCIAFEGRILVVGFAGGEIPAPALNHALVKNYSIVGVHWGLYRRYDPPAIAACHTELSRLADAALVSPVVSERVELADAAGAVQRVGDGTTTGRVVIIPG